MVRRGWRWRVGQLVFGRTGRGPDPGGGTKTLRMSKCWIRLGSFSALDPFILDCAGTFLLGYRTISLFFFCFWTSDHFFLLPFGPRTIFHYAFALGLCLIFRSMSPLLPDLYFLRYVPASALFVWNHVSFLFMDIFLSLQRHCSVSFFLLFVLVLHFSDRWRWEGGRVMSTLGDIFFSKALPTATSSARIISLWVAGYRILLGDIGSI